MNNTMIDDVNMYKKFEHRRFYMSIELDEKDIQKAEFHKEYKNISEARNDNFARLREEIGLKFLKAPDVMVVETKFENLATILANIGGFTKAIMSLSVILFGNLFWTLYLQDLSRTIYR